MKNEIKCPHCGTTFQVSENDYSEIVTQVRNKEFQDEIARQMAEHDKLHKADMDKAALRAQNDMEKRLAEKDKEAAQVAARLENKISELTGIIDSHEKDKKAYQAELETENLRKIYEVEAARDKEVQSLKDRLRDEDAKHRLELEQQKSSISDELNKRDITISELRATLETQQAAAKVKENEMKEQYAVQLRERQDEIERLRDFKTRLSTKMVGETLEQHCLITFQNAQYNGLFPDAVFHKDNDAREGSKGDFIFRDIVNGKEYTSIMFEMKNEMDTTATKHRNEDFLDKLDKDRKQKKCEYAVLVSMLEMDNELYNNGIVDMKYKGYEKMYVIRPQFLMPLIRILSESSRKNCREMEELRSELQTLREQQTDVTKFEEKLDTFKDAFNKNISAAQSKYNDAIKGIDLTIKALEAQINRLKEVKANFESSEQKLLKAGELVDEKLTIKKLTHGNPAMRQRIIEARQSSNSEDND